MSTKNKIPPIVKIGAWLLSLTSFAVGFWHSHLGLKEMKPFQSEYGSLIVSAIILLLILITYHFAVSGRKYSLTFYIIAGLTFFLFNLNYFYPSYNGRQLIKEEAILLNDTLQSFSNRNVLLDSSGNVSDLQDLKLLKGKVLDEIKTTFGSSAQAYLNQFNDILNKGVIDPLKRNEIRPSNAQKQSPDISNIIENQMDNAIQGYIVKKVAEQKSLKADDLLAGIEELKIAQEKYTPILKIIKNDDTEINLDSIKSNQQIKSMGDLVNDLDNATDKINKAYGKDIFPRLVETKTRNLGRIPHTISSIFDRLNKIDTWFPPIFLCLFIDLIIPLFVFIMIKKRDDDDESDFFSLLFSKNKNFNK